MSKNIRTSYTAVGALLLAVSCWGLAPVSTRYLLVDLPPLSLVLIRFGGASLLCLPMCWQLKKQGWSKTEIGWGFICGLFSVIGYNLLVTAGIHWIPASVAGIIIATEPIWILLFAMLFLHEKNHWSVFLGLALSALGVCILAGWNSGQTTFTITTLAGMGLTLLAAMMWGAYTLAVRPLSKRYGAVTCTGLTTILGTLPILPFWSQHLLIQLGAFHLAEWGALLLLIGGSTILATVLWNYGVASMPSTQAGLFLYLIPFISVLGGNFFLHEPMTPGMLISGVLILVGVALAQWRQFTPRSSKAIPLPEEGEIQKVNFH